MALPIPTTSNVVVELANRDGLMGAERVNWGSLAVRGSRVAALPG